MARELPCVMLPGWGYTPAVWNPVIAELEQLGIPRHRILTPGLPAKPHQTLVQTLSPLIRAFPERTHLIGWSLGGALALALTQAMPQQVASLTLISSTPCFMNRADWVNGQPTALLDDFDQRLAADPAALRKRFSMLIRHGDREAGRNHALCETLARTNDADPIRLAAGLSLLREIDLRNAAVTVKTPTLLLHGTNDAVVPMSAARWLHQTISSSTLRQIDHASHALPVTHSHQVSVAIAAMTGSIA